MSDLSEDPHEVAARHGWLVAEPGPCELQLDIDDAAGLAQYEAMVPVLAGNGIRARETRRTTSPGGGTHVYVSLETAWADLPLLLDPGLRVALQCCLGSDPKRELLSALRVLLGTGRPPTVLFEVPS